MRKFILFGIIVIFGFMLMPVASVPAKTSRVATTPKTFVWDQFNFAPTALDPATNYETIGGSMIQVLYEGLYRYANNSVTNIIPLLASNYTISPDGKTYTFTLRQGIKYSDGTPFNAWTMAYSMERALIINDHSGGIWIDEDWVNGTQGFETNSINASYIHLTFLNPITLGIRVIDYTHFSIILSHGFGGFIQAALFSTFDAISPTAIITNEPSNYVTGETAAGNDGHMISLRSMFPAAAYPGVNNASVLTNLGLPSTYNIDNSGIVPQSDVNGTYSYVWLQDHSAGTGPYMLQSLTQGVGATMIKNPNWWETYNANAPGTIKINQVADSATRISDLTTGVSDISDIDSNKLAQIFSWNPITQTTSSLYPNTVQVAAYQNFVNGLIGLNFNNTLSAGQIVEASSSNYGKGSMNCNTLLKFNWNNYQGSPQYSSCSNHISSLLFREDFAYSFDYNTFIQSALSGLGFRMSGVIPKGMLGHDDNLVLNGNIPTFDLTIAKQLFQQVGFQGIVTITYNTGSNERAIAANLLKNAIEQLGVGITVNIQNFAWSAYLTKVETSQLSSYILGWSPDYADPNDYVVPYYLGGFGTYAVADSYNNSYVNNMIQQAAVATAPTIRASMYNQLEINATGDYPFIYLYQGYSVRMVSTAISGLTDPNTQSLNPMYIGLMYQFINETSNPLGFTTTPSLTDTTTSTTSSSQISSSINAPITSSTRTIVISTSPGFELISLSGLFVLSILLLIRKRKTDK